MDCQKRGGGVGGGNFEEKEKCGNSNSSEAHVRQRGRVEVVLYNCRDTVL